jgi:hypothetical protein
MNVFRNYASIRRFIIFLFIMCTLVGLYGCIEEWHGLFDYELKWVMESKQRYGLYFINGHWRKFSTASDPVAFGVLMSGAIVFYVVIAMAAKKISHKIILFTGIIIMLLGMSYSGTRTANAQLLAGLAMYALIDFARKSTRIFTYISVFLLVGVMYAPIYSNEAINRFRSTFQGKKDNSYLVREANRKFIQPYIYAHPIGGGLGTSGAAGEKFNPGHPLAGFPPDSGYLRKAMETGWIGLAIVLVVYFLVVKGAVHGFFGSKNKRIKLLYAAAAPSIFSFYIAEFPQEAVGQITDIMVYYSLVALTIKLKYYEQGGENDIPVEKKQDKKLADE